MDVVLSYLVEKWPSFVIIIITACVVWLLSKWYHSFKKVEGKVDDLPCKKNDDLYARLKKTEESVNNLPCEKHDELFHEIKEQLVAIRTALTMIVPIDENSFSRKNSPRELNEAGEKLYADIKGKEFLDKNKEIFIKGIDAKNPKTALDVEESALEVLFGLINNDMFIGLKNWVYETPSRKIIVDGIEKDYVITMNEVCFVLSLPLRDIYLDLHPELRNTNRNVML